MTDSFQKVLNVVVAVSLLSKVLADEDDDSVPFEVTEANEVMNEIISELQHSKTMVWEDVDELVAATIRLTAMVSEHMIDKLGDEDHIFVFHQSLVLALMDLDRNLIQIPVETSPDDLSEAMLHNRYKLTLIHVLLDKDPTLLDSPEE